MQAVDCFCHLSYKKGDAKELLKNFSDISTDISLKLCPVKILELYFLEKKGGELPQTDHDAVSAQTEHALVCTMR